MNVISREDLRSAGELIRPALKPEDHEALDRWLDTTERVTYHSFTNCPFRAVTRGTVADYVEHKTYQSSRIWDAISAFDHRMMELCGKPIRAHTAQVVDVPDYAPAPEPAVPTLA